MNFFEAIILGTIQGITEFIPISSSAHLDIIPRVLGWENPSTTFILFLHLGTLLSLLLFYRKLIAKYFSIGFRRIKGENLKRKDERNIKVLAVVLLAVLPALILGLLLEGVISNFYDNETNLKVIGVLTLIPMTFFGIVFLFEDKLFGRNKGLIENMSKSRALTIGFAQSIAFIRGVSRSGITLLAGEAVGLKRVEAAEFSFLLSIPLLTATSAYSILKLLQLPSEQLSSEIGPALVGMIAAFISGLLAVKFLLSFLRNHTLKVFGIYRIIAAVILFAIIFL